MSDASKQLIDARAGSIKLDDGAKEFLAGALDKICSDILSGAEKVREYAKKDVVDEEAVKVVSYLDLRMKGLFE